MTLLGHGEAAQLLHETLLGHDTETVSTTLSTAPLWRGTGPNSRWALDSAVRAREIGKPVTVIVKPGSKGTDVDMATGKYRLSLDG